MTSTSTQHTTGGGPAMAVFLFVVAVLSVTGYFVGVREDVRPVMPPSPTPVAHNGYPPAPSYGTIDERNYSPNAGWQSMLSKLAATPNPRALPADRDTAWREAVSAREERRAFDGAPPVIPHAVAQISSAACLTCHGEGRQINDAYAPKISHEVRTDCLACHVESSSRLQSSRAPIGKGTSWKGRRSMRGERANPLGPPTLPHTPQQIAWARADCLSCHGPDGRPGLTFTLDNPAHRDATSNTRCQSCHVQTLAATIDPPR